MAITIKGPQSEVLPNGLGGPNPPTPIRDWFEYAKGQRGVDSYIDGANQVLIVPHDRVTTSALMLCLSEGFTVEGAPMFIVMDAATYAGAVPVGIRNRLDADENPITWADWHDDTHTHMTAADGSRVVAGASWGEDLSSGELVVLLSAGYTLIVASEVHTIMPEGE